MTSINLLNLAKIGQLDPVPLSMDLVKRMLATAKQRNLSDYDGELVTAAALQECLSQARMILIRVESVLRSPPVLGG